MTFLRYSAEASLRLTKLSKEMPQVEFKNLLQRAFEHAQSRGANEIELEDIVMRRP